MYNQFLSFSLTREKKSHARHLKCSLLFLSSSPASRLYCIPVSTPNYCRPLPAMNSQLNNANENQDQVLQETESFRPVFFDLSAKRNLSSSANDLAKRARLDALVIAKDAPQPLPTAELSEVPSPSSSASTLVLDHRALLHRHIILQHHLLSQDPAKQVDPTKATPSPAAFAPVLPDDSKLSRKPSVHRSSSKKSRVTPAAPPATARAPKFIRRFRLRSLPIINYTLRSHMFQHHMFPTRGQQPTFAGASSTSSSTTTPFTPPTHSTPSLPPINLHSLKEIDLHEILKNPQLRHDILFDPQLQFRPNLDGERGRRKRTIIEKYWTEIENECKQFFYIKSLASTLALSAKISRLPVLFTTLRDILLSLLPIKDRAPVNEIMDIDLLVQQLSHGLFDFVAMAKWLGEVFKSHCAPMRDQWVSEMICKFQHAYDENSVDKLVQGLRTIFSILEAMKLDVANHQIRILRPVLIETAVDFEKDYFDQLINHCKIDISDSLKWFYKNFHKKAELTKLLLQDQEDGDESKVVITSSIIDLLSCRNMATEFPSTLAFDHTRLVLLRADVRQLVCVQLCVVLFKQLLLNYLPAAAYRQASCKNENLTKVQEEILAIVTDDNGNVKWTRNVQAIALQLVKNVVTDPSTGSQCVFNLPQSMVDFSYNWLIKQIQPNSDVYGLMEEKIFKEMLKEIITNLNFDSAISALTLSPETKPTTANPKFKKADSEMASIATRISTLVKFHWSVFGEYYSDFLKTHEAA